MRALLVVCHPDDESLWMGAVLAASAAVSDLSWHVVCLSGRDPASPRADEFAEAHTVARWGTGRVLGTRLRPATDPLPEIARTLNHGLSLDNLTPQDFDIVISHSPFGDEHRNPHHKQAHREIKQWAKVSKIPFGFFSPALIPAGNVKPRLRSLHRGELLHATLAGPCRFGLTSRVRYFSWTGSLRPPRFVIQLVGDSHTKSMMLQSYQSIDQSEHRDSYASFTNALETIYFNDRRGFQALLGRIRQLPVPGPHPLFRPLRDFILIAKRRAFGD